MAKPTAEQVRELLKSDVSVSYVDDDNTLEEGIVFKGYSEDTIDSLNALGLAVQFNEDCDEEDEGEAMVSLR